MASSPPAAACRKQKPKMNQVWPERYARIEPPALNFYDKHTDPPSKKRGSSIADVTGCTVRLSLSLSLCLSLSLYLSLALARCLSLSLSRQVRLGLEKFTFDGTQFLITLERRGHPTLPDLDDGGVSQFCFKRQDQRDRFAVALRNLAAGRAWDETEGESAGGVGAGRSAVSGQGPRAVGFELPEASAERPQVEEDGRQADLRFWGGSMRESKNALLCILVNNTQQLLARVGKFEDSGMWLKPPAEAIGAFSTVAWASAGSPGLMGVTTGTSGAIAFRGANFDVVVAYSRPVLGDDRVGGGVFRAGFVTQAKLSRKAAVGHNSSRCSYDRLLSVNASLPASGGVHVAWHSPGGTQTSGASGVLLEHPRLGVPFVVFVVSDQPPQIERLLQPILARSQRSMLVRVENHAWMPLEKRADKTHSGMWKTEAPEVIPPESTVIFASESTGTGTDAHVTYAMSIATSGVTAEALVTLRWVNPLVNTGAKGDFARGKYVDITTEFSCSPGLVVEFDGPSQVDNSTVTFVISTVAGAQPGRFHPEKGSVTRGRVLGWPRAGHTEPQPPRIIIPRPMLELPRRREPASGLAAQLTNRAAKAKRSMVVYIDNQTPFSFRQQSKATLSGTWTQDGEPPTRIEANELVIVVSESTGMGTEACITYRGELNTGQGNAMASFELRWVNPKVASEKRGRYVETKTNFDCNPGLVLHTTGGGPTQTEPSSVRFVLEMKENAQPVHYNPAKYRSSKSAAAAVGSPTSASSAERGAGGKGARAVSQPIDQHSDKDVMWRRTLPLVDMWECMEDCPVRCGPHAASREVGVLPAGTCVRIVEDAWVRTDGSWVPTLALRLVGDGCCTQNTEGAVTQLDGTSHPTFFVEKDDVVAAEHGTQTVIRRYKKGDKFVGVRKVSTGYAVIVADECWVPKWSAESGRPYMRRRRYKPHPPFESSCLQFYAKRVIEVDAGQKLVKKLHVNKDQTVHWQLWAGDEAYQPVKTRITTQPPELASHQVTFRKAMSIVDCFPIKTFEADDWPVHKYRRGEVVRQQNGGRAWRDYDRRWKIAHSTRRNPTRPYWSLQPPDDPDSDMYLRTMPSQLGDGQTKVAIGEFTASETGSLAVELDNTQRYLSEAFVQKKVTYELVVYSTARDDGQRRTKLQRRSHNPRTSAAISETGTSAADDVVRTSSTRSRRHRASHSTSLSNEARDTAASGAALSPCDQLVSQLREYIATGQADPALIAEPFCTEQPKEPGGEGRVTVEGIRMALSSCGIGCTPEELQETLRFFGFYKQSGDSNSSDGSASLTISKEDFLAKVLPQTEKPVSAPTIVGIDSGNAVESGLAEEEGERAVGDFEWLVLRCPYRVCPTKAQWSSVTGALAPGKAGAAWGAAIGAGIGFMAGGIGTGLGAAIGARCATHTCSLLSNFPVQLNQSVFPSALAAMSGLVYARATSTGCITPSLSESGQ